MGTAYYCTETVYHCTCVSNFHNKNWILGDTGPICGLLVGSVTVSHVSVCMLGIHSILLMCENCPFQRQKLWGHVFGKIWMLSSFHQGLHKEIIYSPHTHIHLLLLAKTGLAHSPPFFFFFLLSFCFLFSSHPITLVSPVSTIRATFPLFPDSIPASYVHTHSLSYTPNTLPRVP